jgi:hypothetical protein
MEHRMKRYRIGAGLALLALCGMAGPAVAQLSFATTAPGSVTIATADAFVAILPQNTHRKAFMVENPNGSGVIVYVFLGGGGKCLGASAATAFDLAAGQALFSSGAVVETDPICVSASSSGALVKFAESN